MALRGKNDYKEHVRIISIILLAVIAGVLLYFAYSSFYKSSLESAEIYEKQAALIQMEHVQSRFTEITYISSMLLNSVETTRQYGHTDRDMVIELQKKVLDEFPQVFGINVVYEPNAYDGLDAQFEGHEIYLDQGIFFPYVWRNGNEYVVEYSYSNDDDRSWYDEMKRTLQPVVTNPAHYEIGDNNLVVISTFVPILDDDGTFLGVVCLDFDMDYMQAMLVPSGDERNGAIVVSSNGTIAASSFSKVDQLSYVYTDPQPWAAIATRTMQGEHILEYIESDPIYLVVSYPLELSGNQTWAYISFVSRNTILTKFSQSLSVLLVLLSLLSVLILSGWLMFSASKRSMIDTLTGQYNRNYIETRFAGILHKAYRNQRKLCVIMLDLDDFKLVNDQYGHVVGDLVLKDFAAHIKRNIRSGVDWVARFGGEEFLICLTDTNMAVVERIVNTLQETIRNVRIQVGDTEFGYTFSGGVAFTDINKQRNVTEVIDAADKNLYIAKRTGKDRVVF